jgi:hypothetical protein
LSGNRGLLSTPHLPSVRPLDGGFPNSGLDAPQLFSLPPGWAKAEETAIITIIMAVATNSARLLLNTTALLLP